MSTQTKAKTATSKKTTSAKTSSTSAKTVKKTVAKPSFAGTADLFIVNGVKKLDGAHQFNKQISSIYGVEEYLWTGIIKAGEVKFIRPDGQAVPTNDIYNSGYTLIGKASQLFAVDEALVANSENSDQTYIYGNPGTKLRYVGDSQVHTLYIRIYDDASGTSNNRWLTLAID